MKNKKKLIIGGAGFIGSNLANYLLKINGSVTIFDNFSRQGALLNSKWLQSNYPDVRIVRGDIRFDQEKLKNEIEKADIVYHLAAQVAVTTSVIDPREDFEINALGTFNVLESIRKSKSKSILIYSSTNKVYGQIEDMEIVEKDSHYEYKDYPEGVSEQKPIDFHSPYGCSKGAGDQYVRDYARVYGLNTVVFRQSCIYGPRQFGVEDQGWVAWFIIASILSKPITIFGNGKQSRDILYINDLINAFELAICNIEKTKGKIYNIGGGPKNTISLLELIKHLENFLGKKIDYSFSDWRTGDQRLFVSNISKANEDFKWEPKIGKEEGVRKLFKWAKDNKNLFKNLYLKP